MEPAFRGSGLGFRVSGFGCWVPGFGLRVLGSGFRVSGSGFRVSGFGFRVSGFGYRVSGSGFWVSGVRLCALLPAAVPRVDIRRAEPASQRIKSFTRFRIETHQGRKNVHGVLVGLKKRERCWLLESTLRLRRHVAGFFRSQHLAAGKHPENSPSALRLPAILTFGKPAREGASRGFGLCVSRSSQVFPISGFRFKFVLVSGFGFGAWSFGLRVSCFEF